MSFTRLKSETGGNQRRARFSNIQRLPINPHYVPKDERLPEKKDTHRGSDSVKKKSSSSSSSSSRHSNPFVPSETLKPEKKKEVKKSKPMPPPPSFDELMRVARQNAAEKAEKAIAAETSANKKVRGGNVQ